MQWGDEVPPREHESVEAAYFGIVGSGRQA